MQSVDYRTVLVNANEVLEEIEQHALGLYRELGGFVVLDDKTGSGTTLDVFLESRDWDGNWIQRWHSAQFLSADAVGKASILNALLQETALTNAAQTGLASATLAAGEVRNGYFCGGYRPPALGAPSLPPANVAGAGWRWRFARAAGSGTFTVRVGLRAVGLFTPYSA